MALFRQFPVRLGTPLLCHPFLPSTAQVAFTESSTLLSEPDVHSGVSIGVFDMNKEGYYDILQLNQGTYLKVEYQPPEGTFSGSSIMSVASPSQCGLCVADVDTNGHRDVATGGLYDYVKLLTFE